MTSIAPLMSFFGANGRFGTSFRPLCHHSSTRLTSHALCNGAIESHEHLQQLLHRVRSLEVEIAGDRAFCVFVECSDNPRFVGNDVFFERCEYSDLQKCVKARVSGRVRVLFTNERSL